MTSADMTINYYTTETDRRFFFCNICEQFCLQTMQKYVVWKMLNFTQLQ